MKTNPNDLINPTTFMEHGTDGKGLTKREYIATHIFSSFATNPDIYVQSLESIAGAAVKWADGLISELNKGIENE